MLMKLHRIGALKFIVWHASQLKADLKKENLKQKELPSNQRDTIKWNRRCK